MSAINFSGKRSSKQPAFSGLDTDTTRRQDFSAGGLRKFNVGVKPLQTLPTPTSMIDRFTRGTADKFWEACPEFYAQNVKVGGSKVGSNIIGRSTTVVPNSLFDRRYALDFQQNIIPNLGISNTRKITVSNM